MTDIRHIATDRAPAAIGPYSQAVVAAGFVFASGQIPLTPAGEMTAGTAAQQAERVFDNVRAVLAAAGSDLGKVVKTTVFLTDMNDFAEVNEVYAKAFGTHRPARSTVAVAALPRGAKVEIEVLALAP